MVVGQRFPIREKQNRPLRVMATKKSQLPLQLISGGNIAGDHDQQPIGCLQRSAKHPAKSSLWPKHGTMRGMFRFPAILVVVALLASPLALLARGLACDSSQCDCMAMCQRQAAHDRHLCGGIQHAPMCGTHQGRHAIDYGFVAPIPPTAPLPSRIIFRPASATG